jgi:hypothetical protein
MSFLDSLRRSPTAGQPRPGDDPRGRRLPDPREKVRQISQDPGVLREGGFNFPQDMTDGNQILDYLVQTRQVNPMLLRNPLVMRAAQMLSAQR